MEKIIRNKIGVKNIKLTFIYFVIGYVSHIAMWVYHVASTDTNVVTLFRYTPDWEATLGRWFIYCVDNFRHYISSPFISGTIALAFYAVGTVLAMEVLNISDIVYRVMLGALLMVTPCVSNTLMFYYCADSYAIAWFLAITFAYEIKKQTSVLNYSVSVITLTLCMGLYQAYIGTAAALCTSTLIIMLMNGAKIVDVIKKSIYMLTSALVACVLYLSISKIVLKAIGADFSAYGGADLLKTTTILDIKIAIALAYQKFYELLFSFLKRNMFYRVGVYSTLAVIMAIILLITIILKRKLYKEPLRVLGIIGLFVIFPMACGVVLFVVKYHGIHILMCQAYYLLFLLLGAIVSGEQNDVLFDDKNGDTVKRKVDVYVNSILSTFFLVATALFIFELFIINNSTYEYNKMVRNSVVSTAQRVLERAESLDGYHKDIDFAFVGQLMDVYPVDSYMEQMAYLETSTLRSNYYRFTTAIIENIYREDLGCYINICDDNKYVELVGSDRFENMPIFPENGSIVIEDNCVLVKLSDEIQMPEDTN